MENDGQIGIVLWLIIGVAILVACGLLSALMLFLGYLVLS